VRHDSTNFITYPFTVSAWIKTTSTGTSTFASLTTSSNSTLWTVGIKAGKARLIARNTTIYETLGTLNIADNAWHHIVAVFESPALRRLYVDGTLDGTDTNSVAIGAITRFAVGRVDRPTPVEPFPGSLDDIRLHRGALTPEQIRAP